MFKDFIKSHQCFKNLQESKAIHHLIRNRIMGIHLISFQDNLQVSFEYPLRFHYLFLTTQEVHLISLQFA